MKFVSIFAFLASSVAASGLDQSSFEMELMGIQFNTWADAHGKVYTCEHSKAKRFEIWRKNHELIEQHNSKHPSPSYRLGHNEYSDMTLEEFQAHFKLGQPVQASDVKPKVSNSALAEEIARSLKEVVDLPDYTNWILQGGVTPVKNQGACGSCWAFSTTGALEGAKYIHTGELVALSEQNLIDCDHQDLGCNGGLMDNAFKFDEKSGGLCSEKDYPYKAAVGTCNTKCTDVPGSIVKTFVDVPPSDERALLAALAMQPISIAIQADQLAFQFYRDGVINDESCGKKGDVDHGVLAVGYGTDLETQIPYWLVKNSWGESWGDAGYVKLARNSTNEWGMCAILKMSSFPVVE